MMIKTPIQEKKNGKARPNKRPRAKTRSNGRSSSGNNGRVHYGTARQQKQKTLGLPSVPAWKMILGAIAIGALGVVYLNHVFATQQLLSEVQQLENEFQKAKRRHADYRLTYDRMIGPKEIYQKAKNQGFINGGPADKVITVPAEYE